MKLSADLHQRLLELEHDLLPADQAAELRQRCQTDAELAEALAAVRRQCALLAAAARLEEAPIQLVPPAGETAVAPRRYSMQRSAVVPIAPAGRPLAWALGLAAALLLLVGIAGRWTVGLTASNLEDDFARLVVTGPAIPRQGVPNNYTIAATNVLGEPLATRIETRVLDPQGEQVFHATLRTDERGRARAVLPATMELTTGSTLEVTTAAGGAAGHVATRLAVDGPRRRAYITVDKPLYQPGETVYYRSLSLAQFSFDAQGSAGSLPVEYEIRDPSGAVVPGSQLQGQTEQGVGNGAFVLPADLAGGAYKLVVRALDGSFADQEREFFVRQYRLPRLKKELEFTRDSYAPGDTVVADLSATQAEGQAAAAAGLSIVATVDGQRVYEGQAATDAAGRHQVRFELPLAIERGAAQLAVVIDDGGAAETIAKTIPINLGKVALAFYPEGGDLVAGLKNRVYFSARDPLGEPVHVEGQVVDDGGRQVARVETVHEGMGAFWFTPQPEETYRVKLDRPLGVEADASLPAVGEDDWLVMTAGAGVFQEGKPIEITLTAARGDRPLVVSAVCRGSQVAQQAVLSKAGERSVALQLPPEASGVVRVTVHDYGVEPPLPICERLVYCRPQRRLEIRVKSPREGYAPGERVELALKVLDEAGNPAAAVLGVAVVDDALLSLADDDSPRMTTHFLLTSEVENAAELEDADFYLSSKPDAAGALDLLLGTQGWRRFVEKRIEHFIDQNKPDDARQLAELGPVPPPALFDNLAQVEPPYRAALAAWRAAQQQRLGTVLFFGSLALLFGAGLAATRGWLPNGRLAMGVAAAAAGSLALGIMHLQTAPPGDGSARQVAFQSFALQPASPPGEDAHNGANWPLFAGEMPFDGRQYFDTDWMMLGDAAMPPADLRRLAERDGAADKFFYFGFNPTRDYLTWSMEHDPSAPALGRRDPTAAHLFGQEAGGSRLGASVAHVMAKQPAPRGLGSIPGQGAPLVVRQYAHRYAPSGSNVRSDFAETLCWMPLVLTDADGAASVDFDLSDSVTTFAVRAEAHGGGRLGCGGHRIESRIPFSLAPKLPLEVTAGDRIEMPLSISNDTQDDLQVELALSAAGELVEPHGPTQRQVGLPAAKKQREHFVLDVVGHSGQAAIEIRGSAAGARQQNLSDAVRRDLRIVPDGFPVHRSYGGILTGQHELIVELPDDLLPNSLQVALNAYPSRLADLQQGLESILSEPAGCFEQASTSNYPNVLSLEFLEEHRVASPELTRRARELLTSGYARLSGFESPSKGYEWFGADPGHEALTAYGLMQFRDMAGVFEVDQAMMERTAAWLRSRRDGQGGYLQNPKALDSFGGAPKEITDAYITWALAESGEKELAAELDHVQRLAQSSHDAYLVSLAAAGLLAAGREEPGRDLLEKLGGMQQGDGHLDAKKGSITRSGGVSLAVETTALAALAWLKLPEYRERADRAIDWIVSNRQAGGGFGSTQGTILALKALIEHAKADSVSKTGGEIVVQRDGHQVARQTFGPDEQQTIQISGIEAHLQAGDNRLTINLSGEDRMPYGLDVSYRSIKLDNHPDCPLRLSTKLDAQRVEVGKTVALTAELASTSDEGLPMAVAILGLPAGLEPRADQLNELKKAGVIDYYETRAREVICYWRSLAPKRTVQVQLDLVAEVPGRYTAPASRTYLYYTAEQKYWVRPLSIAVSR